MQPVFITDNPSESSRHIGYVHYSCKGKCKCGMCTIAQYSCQVFVLRVHVEDDEYFVGDNVNEIRQLLLMSICSEVISVELAVQQNILQHQDGA